MSKKTVAIMPSTRKVLENMGEQIKLARLRRNLSTELLSERAGISRATLWAVEKRFSYCCDGNICSSATCSRWFG